MLNAQRHREMAVYQLPSLETIDSKEAFLKRVSDSCNPSFFEKTLLQNFIAYYLSSRQPNRSMLLYHAVGAGKTCSAITLAEALLAETPIEQSGGASSSEPDVPKDKSLLEKLKAPIWVVLPKTLRKPFLQQIVNTSKLLDKEQLLSQCTADTYAYLIPNKQTLDPEALQRRVQQLVKTRYTFFTYESFKSVIQQLQAQRQLSAFQNKLLIIDEAHNLRTGNQTKKLSDPLISLLETGLNNRLLLLTATPMYNEADEILWLLSLCTANDKQTGLLDPRHLPLLFDKKHEKVSQTFKLIETLSRKYISYIRGENPFTFATRLRPSQSQIPTLTEAPTLNMNQQPLSKDNWLKHIPDELVPTPLSPAQEIYMTNHPIQITETESTTLTELFQAANVVFPNPDGSYTTGKKEGFNTCFIEADTIVPTQFKHAAWCQKPSQQPLRDSNLLKHAPKIAAILKHIEESKGIVLVYSQFIWNGILPLAIALEHAGYQRIGARAICADAKPKGKFKGTYGILCGKDSIMGGTQETILNKVNALSNKDGSEVKVILMSRVASEGLSFMNVREVHIMDPWYHLNLVEQITGRAIRTCSHIALPLEERNVTVFLHVATDPQQKIETADLHAYHIASGKEYETTLVNKVIQSNALDCQLAKALNVFPKTLFKFDIVYRTSRNVLLPYHFGDEHMIQCHTSFQPTPQSREPIRGIENVFGLITTLYQRLRRILHESAQRGIYVFDHDDLVQQCLARSDHPWMVRLIDHALVYASKPHMQPFVDNYTLLPHLDKWLLTTPNQDQTISYLKLKWSPKQKIKEVQPINPETADQLLDSLIANLSKDDLVATLFIYTTINSASWPQLAQQLVQQTTQRFQVIQRILLNTGALIGSDELYGESASQKIPTIIGYVDLFEPDSKFKATLYDSVQATFRQANELELKQIQRNRTQVEIPKPGPNILYGLLAPYKSSKVDPSTPYHMEFKVFYPEVEQQIAHKATRAHTALHKRRGIVCRTSNNKSDIVKAIEILTGKKQDESGTKDALCQVLSNEMNKKQKLFIPPFIKRKTTLA
jgi:hypothetical protein